MQPQEQEYWLQQQVQGRRQQERGKELPQQGQEPKRPIQKSWRKPLLQIRH
jgi:hypothetical protein